MKRILAVLLAMAITMLLLCACTAQDTASNTQTDKATQTAQTETASADEQTVYELKLGTTFDDPTLAESIDANPAFLDRIANGLEEATDGRIKVTPYYSSTLGGAVELTEQLITGEIDIQIGQIPATIDARQGIWTVPYLFSDLEEVQEYLANPDAELFKMSQEWAADYGIYLACTPVSSFRGIANNVTEITDTASVKNLSIRTYEDAVGKIFWSSLCNCSVISMGELFTSMQTGAVDGYEMNAVSIATVSVFYDMTEKYSNIDWQWDNTQNVYFNMDSWNSLPEDLQTIVSDYLWECCDLYAEEKMALLEEERLTELFGEVGIEYHALTEQERQSWIDAARACDDEFKTLIGEETWDAVWQILNG